MLILINANENIIIGNGLLSDYKNGSNHNLSSYQSLYLYQLAHSSPNDLNLY